MSKTLFVGLSLSRLLCRSRLLMWRQRRDIPSPDERGMLVIPLGKRFKWEKVSKVGTIMAHCRAYIYFTLMLLVANLANTKKAKNTKNYLNPGKWVLIWEYSARAFQWIPTWQGLDFFQKSLSPCALEESSVSIGRVKMWIASIVMLICRDWVIIIIIIIIIIQWNHSRSSDCCLEAAVSLMAISQCDLS